VLTTGLVVGGTATAAMASPPSGFCGAWIEGHHAWYRNCSNSTVRRAADYIFAFDPCVSIGPWATYHWHDIFNIRRVYAC
jgi:hypothetical protein